MNKLITTNNGGFPLELDDIRFEQDAIRDAFYGLISGFGIAPADSFILSGCQVTGSPVPGAAYSAGYLCLNGEVFKVDAATLPAQAGGEVYYWDAEVTYDTAGNEQFESGTSYNTYQVRKAKVYSGVQTPGAYMPLAAKTFKQKLDDLVGDPNDAWTTYSIVAGDVSVAGGGTVSSLGTAKFHYKKVGKTMFFQLRLVITIGTGGTQVDVNLASIFLCNISVGFESAGTEFLGGKYLNVFINPNSGVISFQRDGIAAFQGSTQYYLGANGVIEIQ